MTTSSVHQAAKRIDEQKKKQKKQTKNKTILVVFTHKQGTVFPHSGQCPYTLLPLTADCSQRK